MAVRVLARLAVRILVHSKSNLHLWLNFAIMAVRRHGEGEAQAGDVALQLWARGHNAHLHQSQRVRELTPHKPQISSGLVRIAILHKFEEIFVLMSSSPSSDRKGFELDQQTSYTDKAMLEQDLFRQIVSKTAR
jgi:hypothetical protein